MEAFTKVHSKVIYVDDIEEEEKEACLVGCLVSEENWNPENVIEAIKEAWKLSHGVSWRELKGESKLMIIYFDDAFDRDWVMKHQPWLYEGYLFAIDKFEVGKEEHQPSCASFCARLYDVPISCMNVRSLRIFVEQIGMIESVDRSGEDLTGKFIRFKVSLNITEPLVRGISISVKGEHVWLPLKYESLPVYCFSCGTIGHTHHNCRQSFDPNLKYSSCKWEERKYIPTTLPLDIIENILSRVPVKYLLRFRAVCKQWESIISDPRFAEMHLQHYKNSSYRNLLAWEETADYNGLYVAEFKNRDYRFVAAIEHSREYNLSCMLVNYDGLYLYLKVCDADASYVLWNPSCRAYREFYCPQPIDYSSNGMFYGLYYNPLVKDYRVVIGDMKHYAVFSCWHNKWSDVKEMKIFCSSDKSFYHGCPFNGSFYLLQRSEDSSKCELICFDGEEESFKKVALPDYGELREHDDLCLRCFGGHLCLFFMYHWFYDEVDDKPLRFMRIIKRVNGDEEDSWMEVKVLSPLAEWYFFSFCRPICCQISEDEIFLSNILRETQYILYDKRNNSFELIDKMSRKKYRDPFPFLENLFVV